MDEALKCCRCGNIRGDDGDRLRLQRECENFDICAKCKDFFYKEFTKKKAEEPKKKGPGRPPKNGN